MKGTIWAWDLGDVEEALGACLDICTSAAVGEEHSEAGQELLDKATRHISNALARVREVRASNQESGPK